MIQHRMLRMSLMVVTLALLVGVPIMANVWADGPPTQEEIDVAHGAMDRLESELFAALLNEFASTTPENFEQGSLAIQLIFADRNRSMRLVGDMEPLGGNNNLPADNFERQSLVLAMQGQSNETTQKVKGKWYVRRSIPLSNFDESCVICHANFGSTPNPNEWTGALMLRVPTDPTNLP
jgi:hypothetical protein